MPYPALSAAPRRPSSRWESLPHLLSQRVQERPEATLYRFLDHGEREGVCLTCGELDRRARAVAAALRQAGCGGERVLLLFPPGADFFVAFFGCLYAAAVAVPVYPPRPNDRLERLDAVAADCAARGVLTVAALRSRVETWAAAQPAERPPVVLAVDDLPAAGDWRMPDLRADSLALLQYTSGSTATPRGVCVTHAHLLENSACIDAGFRHDADSVIVSWLPTFHDMGLVYGVIQPLYAGVPAVHMSPLSFLQRPARWLRAVSRYRGTHSGGPNFGYELCLRKVRPEQETELDLSSWRVAYNGSEPVRADTLQRFADVFAALGFRSHALCPAYGMAETTLKVSAASPGEPVTVLSVDAAALEEHRLRPVAPGSPGARRLVGCGPVGDGLEVRIVDPESATPCD
ncbi:MAG: AMP-binding protein, partial [Nitrospirota bacterium]